MFTHARAKTRTHAQNENAKTMQDVTYKKPYQRYYVSRLFVRSPNGQ